MSSNNSMNNNISPCFLIASVLSVAISFTHELCYLEKIGLLSLDFPIYARPLQFSSFIREPSTVIIICQSCMMAGCVVCKDYFDLGNGTLSLLESCIVPVNTKL